MWASNHLFCRFLSTLLASGAVILVATERANAQFIIAQSDPSYLAFEAEQFSNNVSAVPAEGFVLYSTEEPITLDSGAVVLPADTNAFGIGDPAVMFDQVGGPQTDQLQYQLEFSSPGPYYLYMHYSLYDLNADGAYGNEDSLFFPRDFGLDPSGPLSDNNYWALTPSGTPQFPAGQEGTPTEGNYQWVRAADNAVGQGTAWEYNPTLNTVLDFAIAARENGTTVDKFVFSTSPDISAEELDAIPSFIPIPPGFNLGDFNEDGAIDAADFAIMTENFNAKFSVDEAYLKGDMNGNLRVELSDFIAFRKKFSGGGAAASVPEPASLTLIGWGLCTGIYLARRRRRRDLR